MKAIALEKVLLVIYKIVRQFVNALTADDKQYLLNGENLKQPIEMQLSEKQKTFSHFFFAFFISMLNFKDFPKNDEPQS